ncbi:MAG TPA: efflux RND transporter periplasmic adaptor subunit [Tepidisphaeraceae bacterium]|jgi:RND family efflux transporter MFP subunit
MSWTRASLAALSLSGLCLAAGPGSEDTSTPFPAITSPSQKRQQNFDVPGVVQKLLVKEGDVVKAGELLAEQNIEGDEAHLRSLELQSKATGLEIEAAKAQEGKDQVDLERKEKMLLSKSANIGDVEEARLQVHIDSLKGQSAVFKQDQSQADLLEQKARIKQKKLNSKIDGIVSEINTHEGELANNDTQHPTITIVKNDPLYVEVWLPAPLVTRLKADSLKTVLQVQYVDEDKAGKWRDAKIHFIRPQADAQSNMEYVQLEMPNPEGRSSGLQVMVRMPTGAAPVGAAASNR